jgi:hypothetical protein
LAIVTLGIPPESLTSHPSQFAGIVDAKSYAGFTLTGRIVVPSPLPSPLRAIIIISTLGPEMAPLGGFTKIEMETDCPGSKKGRSSGVERFHPTAFIAAER